ncbi:MAG: hypothetical protein IPH43_14985 [Xanthomonadales bacterium]|nr:hypothetical protein [Xanthomonadales bacterium]
MTIRGTGNDIVLERLNLIRGDEVYDGYGGLISRAPDSSPCRNVGIAQNYAGVVVAVSALFSDGGLADLRIESGTVIQLNTSQFSGGGIRLEGNVYMTMFGTGSAIVGNEARGLNPNTNQPQYGYGGGLQVPRPGHCRHWLSWHRQRHHRCQHRSLRRRHRTQCGRQQWACTGQLVQHGSNATNPPLWQSRQQHGRCGLCRRPRRLCNR